MAKRYESLMDLYKITQYKDGCVYKTAFVERVWVDTTNDTPPEGHVYCSLPTSVLRDNPNLRTNRVVEG